MDAREDRRSGFTLVELLITMTIGLVVLFAAYGFFIFNHWMLTNEQQIADMQQNARSGMDLMARELKMAGYNLSNPPTQAAVLPKCTGITTSTVNPCRGIVHADQTHITFTAANINDQITYYLDAGNLMRASLLDPPPQIVAGNINSLAFAYAGATGNLSDIREIVITITAITAGRDPAYHLNGGYRTYTLTTKITPTNLVY